jgi:hypothetical protein
MLHARADQHWVKHPPPCAAWPVLLVLEDADDKLTRRDILAQWPADFPRPADSTLWGSQLTANSSWAKSPRLR